MRMVFLSSDVSTAPYFISCSAYLHLVKQTDNSCLLIVLINTVTVKLLAFIGLFFLSVLSVLVGSLAFNSNIGRR
jgi:nicotinamide riboside transporter PnuC